MRRRKEGLRSQNQERYKKKKHLIYKKTIDCEICNYQNNNKLRIEERNRKMKLTKKANLSTYLPTYLSICIYIYER